ncbi:MAG: Redoxin protein [Candidatus Peregrinibacteria bacterium Greene1014_49]|nr:MAG: Redoxin protein [Candidatus Peregrinibacteria bacterium Greene1014_49]
MSTLPIALILFLAGMLTILLPCILPLLPIVLGVSIAGRNRWRPLLTVLGMVVSFVGFTFLLTLVLSQFVAFADILRIATYYILLLFGVGFLTSNRTLQLLGAVLGGFFFNRYGWIAVTAAQTIGAITMELGSKVAVKIQQFGGEIQQGTGAKLGRENPLSAFIIGLTLGLVWVPCAGPALGFAFALVRDEPGPRAAFLLMMYGLGTALPLLLVGYGGQAAVQRVRSFNRYSGRIKQIAGGILILTALGLQYGWLMRVQTYLVQNTAYGTLGTEIEERLFDGDAKDEKDSKDSKEMISSSSFGNPSTPSILPNLGTAPKFAGLGPWHNGNPLTMEELHGKVVLIDFWTYSCINCIRTLPYIQGYWETFKDTGKFVLIGVHTPEFVFEKDQKNVADAIKRHGLTYPVAQDNDFGTWNAFRNRYWPAKYLIDAEGNIRYTHFGEGAYEETEEAIRSLLGEIGVIVNPTSSAAGGLRGAGETGERYGGQTPEIYLGSRSWAAFGNGGMFPTSKEVMYSAPEEMELHTYYLDGTWQLVDEEQQVLRSDDGEIRMKFLGGEINLVMGVEGMAKAGAEDRDLPLPVVEVFVDGVVFKDFTVDRYDLFELWKGEYGEHKITLKINGKGVEGYAFTFGQ